MNSGTEYTTPASTVLCFGYALTHIMFCFSPHPDSSNKQVSQLELHTTTINVRCSFSKSNFSPSPKCHSIPVWGYGLKQVGLECSDARV
jgi:hypothetical protein